MSSLVSHGDVGGAWSQVGAGNVVELVVDACMRNPHVPALIFEDGLAITCQELLDAAERFAGYLRQRCSPGERVAIMMSNRTEFMVAWIASMAARTTLVSLNTAFQQADASHVLSDCEASLIIAEEQFAPVIEAVLPRCPAVRDVIYVAESEPFGLTGGELSGQRFSMSRHAADRSDITNIYYTSGSTGPPKGCMLDHEYWLRFADLFLRLYELRPTDRLLCCLQFFYGDPPWQLVASLRAGVPLIVMRRFSVSRFFGLAREHRVSALFTIASIPTLLLKAPPTLADRGHSMRFGLHLGIPSTLHHEFNERWGFPWVEGYGLTESGLVVAMPLELARRMEGSGSIGVPCPEVSVRIIDRAGGDVPAGETGEILVRAPGVMRGYLNQPDATAEVLRDGWVHTGDLARRDGRGFIYFVGRMKDLIRRNGVNIAAAEVEQVLRAHPLVLDAAVVPVPDDLRGEEVKAFVVPVDVKDPPRMEDLVGLCASKLAAFKVPRYIDVCPDFPRTPSMRVKKEFLRSQPAVGAATWDSERVR